MAVLGTFSSFTTARLGIYASQASLNVTGNNIANINTTGYTRQRMDLVSLYSKGAGKYANIFNRNVGYGVLAETRTQLRDPFLDIRYRNENTNLAANTEKYNGLYQLSHTLDEVNKGTDKDEGNGVIQANLANFVTALEKLHANVGSQEFDRQVRGEAESLTVFFNEAAKALQSVYDGKAEEFTQTLKETNVLLNDIRDLNEQIRTAALYGDTALELRDQRNLDLDKLSELMHINVEYSMERVDQFTEVEKLTVTIAGSKGPDGKPIKLIDGIYGGQISVQDKEPLMNPDYDPVKINAEKEVARRQAEADYAKAFKTDPNTGNPTTTPTDGYQKVLDLAQTLLQGIKDANPIDNAKWTNRLAELEKEAIAKAKADKLEELNGVDPKPDPPITELTEDQIAEAEAKGKTDAAAQLNTEWEAEMQSKAENAARQQLVNEDVAAKEAELIKTAGKYYESPYPLDPENEEDKVVIDAAKDAARTQAEADYAEGFEADGTTPTEGYQKVLDLAKTLRKDIEDANPFDSTKWADTAAWDADMQTRAETAAREQLIEADVKAAEEKVIQNPVFTNDVTKATTFENDKFLLQVDPLKDRRDRLMIDPNTVSKESEVVELDDTVLYGKIQSQRELLTEEGEYASNADLNRGEDGKTADPPRLSGDPDAGTKRGIPYYQKALDSLARQLAEEFNQANQLPATTVYQQMQVVVDADGKLVPGADPAKPGADQKVVTGFIDKSNPGSPVLDGEGKVITTNDVTKLATEPAMQQKVDENGKPVVDADGNPVMEPVMVEKKDADGNTVMEPVMEEKTDADGNKVMVPVMEEVWQEQKDKDGNTVMQDKKDDKGNVMVDAEGNPIKEPVMEKVMVPVMVEQKDADGKLVLDADGRPVMVEKKDDAGKIVKEPKMQVKMQPVMEPKMQPVLDENGKETGASYTMADGGEYGHASELLNVLAQKGVKDPLYEFYDGGVLFSNNGNTNDPSGITASNITVSHGWATETVHVLNDKRPDSYREDGTVIKHSSRNDNIRHMITLFDQQLEYSAKDVQGDSAATDPIFKGSFREVYTTIEGILGTDQSITEGKMNNYQVMTLSLENDRQSVSGVDLNDEATNMMQFSKSYAAACRLLTTIDSMLDKLINGTAV